MSEDSATWDDILDERLAEADASPAPPPSERVGSDERWELQADPLVTPAVPPGQVAREAFDARTAPPAPAIPPPGGTYVALSDLSREEQAVARKILRQRGARHGNSVLTAVLALIVVVLAVLIGTELARNREHKPSGTIREPSGRHEPVWLSEPGAPDRKRDKGE